MTLARTRRTEDCETVGKNGDERGVGLGSSRRTLHEEFKSDHTLSKKA